MYIYVYINIAKGLELGLGPLLGLECGCTPANERSSKVLYRLYIQLYTECARGQEKANLASVYRIALGFGKPLHWLAINLNIQQREDIAHPGNVGEVRVRQC